MAQIARFTLKPLTLSLFAAMHVFSGAQAQELPQISAYQTGQLVDQQAELTHQAHASLPILARQLLGADSLRAGGADATLSLSGLSGHQLGVLALDRPLIGFSVLDAHRLALLPVSNIQGVAVISAGQGLWATQGRPSAIQFVGALPVIHPKNTHGELEASLASNAATQRSLTVWQANPNFYARGGFSETEQKSYESGRGEEVASSFTADSGFIDVGWGDRQNQQFSLQLSRNTLKDERRPQALMDVTEAFEQSAQLSGQWAEWRGLSRIHAQVSLSQTERDADNFSLRDSDEADAQYFSEGQQLNLRLKAESQWRDVQFLWGFSAHQASLETLNRADAGVVLPKTETRSYALTSEAARSLTPSVVLKAGARLSQNLVEAQDIGPKFDESLMDAFVRVQGQLGVHQWSAAYSLTHAIPTAEALFVDTPTWKGVASLGAETHQKLEGVFSSQLGAHRLQTRIFYSQVADWNEAYYSEDKLTYRSIDASLRGVEVSGSTRLGDGWSVRGQLAYLDAKNDTLGGELALMPPLNGLIQLNKQLGKWDVAARYRFAQDSKNLVAPDNTPSPAKAEGYGLWDAYAYYNFNNKAVFKFGIDNLTDEYYVSAVPVRERALSSQTVMPEPGRQLWAKFSWQF